MENFLYTPSPIEAAKLSTEERTALDQEGCLVVEIVQLWNIHSYYQQSRQELKKAAPVRRQLAEQLFKLKTLLARPGCSGRWSAFLRENGIARATGDRLVTCHERSLHPANCISDPIQSIEAQVEKLFRAVWPRIHKVLTNREALDLFIARLVSSYQQSEAERSQAQTPAAFLSSDEARNGDSGEDSQLITSPPPLNPEHALLSLPEVELM